MNTEAVDSPQPSRARSAAPGRPTTGDLAAPAKPASARAKARDRRDSRWDEHRRARREQLVDATVAAISRHGAGVGMDEIAAAAGTSKTVVYRHFADRTDLYVAVCARVAEQLLPRLRAAMEHGDSPRAMTTAAVEAYLAFCEADPALYRFVVHLHPTDRPVDADPIDNLSDLVGDEAAGLLRTALTQTGRDPAPAGPWGHGLIGLVRAAADWWLRADRPMPRAELAAHLTDLAWSGLTGVVPMPDPGTTRPAPTARPTSQEEQ